MIKKLNVERWVEDCGLMDVKSLELVIFTCVV